MLYTINNSVYYPLFFTISYWLLYLPLTQSRGSSLSILFFSDASDFRVVPNSSFSHSSIRSSRRLQSVIITMAQAESSAKAARNGLQPVTAGAPQDYELPW